MQTNKTKKKTKISRINKFKINNDKIQKIKKKMNQVCLAYPTVNLFKQYFLLLY